ncbi:hypothetical protein B9G55_22685 [Saccharibacillus sp. O16]|nr:hypothetical protein B9G55_22685 [Saccharibacillus sp. O16]
MNIHWENESALSDPRFDARFYDGISLQEYEGLTARWQELLALTLRAVNGYVNDDELCFSEEEGMFPVRKRLSGKAYIGAVSYAAGVDPVGFRILIEVRLTEGMGAEEQDYLGLEVTWFARAIDGEWECWGMDSAAI